MTKSTNTSQYHLGKKLSPELSDVISNTPKWIVRKGNAIIVALFMLLFSLTFFITYPDVIKGRAVILAINAPKLIKSYSDGKLTKLFVTNNLLVKKGQVLGAIDNNASFNEVMSLKCWVSNLFDSVRIKNIEILEKYECPRYDSLGVIQPEFQKFQEQFILTKQTIKNGFYQNKIVSLMQDQSFISKLRSHSIQQLKLTISDTILYEKELKAYEELAKQKVIAPLELNQFKSKMILKEQELQQKNAQITNYDISSNNKLEEINDLNQQINIQRQTFIRAITELETLIDSWFEKYILITPIDGKVLFISDLQENEIVSTGQNLFYVEPERTKYFSELRIGQNGLGKVNLGQKVFINLESYPVSEYGHLIGVVSYISEIPYARDSFYLKVDLNSGLITNEGKEIRFRNNLVANAEIITSEKKLNERILSSFYSLFKR